MVADGLSWSRGVVMSLLVIAGPTRSVETRQSIKTKKLL